ncbi:sensor histidine kinase [Streptacidiphilus rugosus]|uniref:sensor histidine kinase n=1 Tax=Streptacidiphilus rugosus TaxID=405783 RepID=UPI00068EDD5E|nr:ATP-binding protein [Streptacidiphilus rugosus]
MRFRRRSIRAKITALLLVPLTALTGLWAYTSVLSVGQVWGLIQVNTDYKWFGNPADTLSRALQDERRVAVAFSAVRLKVNQAPPPAIVQPLQAAEAATDAAAAVFQAHVKDPGHRGDLTKAELVTVQAIQVQLGELTEQRSALSKHYLDWYSVYGWYTTAQDPFFTLRLELSDISGGDLSRTAQNLIELVRAREYISREDALEEGAHLRGALSQEQFQELLATGATEQLLFKVHYAQLPDPIANLYAQFTESSDYFELNSLEGYTAGLGAIDAISRMNYPQWRETADRVLGQLSTINQQAATLAGNEARDYAIGVIRDDAIAGLGGLLAVVATVFLSLRIGRRLVKELVGLRDGAFELAGVRLPAVMQRLRDGEKVDVAVEAPPLHWPGGATSGTATDGAARDELAQLGRAFNAVQHAAVEAAVEQAELRRGVAAVFVNLARRSQSLLHRQLSLLDEMERRAEEPGELEDLFRLDHLTTRMRRHAEGLIILSGAAPGRSWRRPVRVLDVVRAGVGEIEDYARVRVHRMPPVAVVGAAVSDLVHLLAELVENATVFSPPHTQVRIQGEEVANGFVLEIDDRGLGMSEEALLAANDRLATGGDFDLGDTDRLGLFVVSRLAFRHQIRVSLRRSPYGGTTAVVLLPRELLTPAQPRPGDADAAGEHVEPAQLTRIPRDPGRQDRRRTEVVRVAVPTGRHRSEPAPAAQGGPRPHTPDEGLSTGGLPRRRPQRALPAAPTPALAPSPRQEVLDEDILADTLLSDVLLAEQRAAADRSAAQAIGPATSATVSNAGDTPPALPRRIRQANLAPQLRRVTDSGSAASATAPRVGEGDERTERTPEQARATFASFQRGLSRGREEQRDHDHRRDQNHQHAATTDPTSEGTTR